MLINSTPEARRADINTIEYQPMAIAGHGVGHSMQPSSSSWSKAGVNIRNPSQVLHTPYYLAQTQRHPTRIDQNCGSDTEHSN